MNLYDVPIRVHLIGIGGAGMSALAQYLLELGHSVSGSDLISSHQTQSLEYNGARISHVHLAENVDDVDLVVTSDAVPWRNVELTRAYANGIPVLKRAECLHLLCLGKNSLLIAGSHGKSTTTAMIAKVIKESGCDPGFIIGESVPCLTGLRGHVGSDKLLVAEACEAFKNLSFLKPQLAVITNIDDEHLEHFGTQAAIDQSFAEFANRVGHASRVIVNGDDEGIRRILSRLTSPVVSFGFEIENDFFARDLVIDSCSCSFDVFQRQQFLGKITIPIPGRHIAENALACIAACIISGVRFDDIVRGLSGFSGVARRWQDYGVVNQIHVIDDYAHHPTELSAILSTARETITTAERLVIVFQPQLYSRTRRLSEEFGKVLSKADHVLLLDIDSAGEAGIEDVTSELIAKNITRLGGVVDLVGDVEEFQESHKEYLKSSDFVLVAGAGSIRSAARKLVESLRADTRNIDLLALANAPQELQKHDRLKFTPFRSKQFTTVLDLFSNVVARQEDIHAISDESGHISYSELEIISDKFARALQSRGVKLGDVIGVRISPSREMICLLLAIFKAGAVYLPIDVAIPTERAKYMLMTAGAKLLVSDDVFSADLPRCSVSQLVEELKQIDFKSADMRTRPSDTAYICFTSGSTGYPKGIPVAHSALALLIKDIAVRFGVVPGSKTALNTSISFDVSLAEILMTLCGGGTLCLSGSKRPLVGHRLGSFIRTKKITHLAATPSVISTLAIDDAGALQTIIAAGEPCPQTLVDRWAERRSFFNVYGPTEATIYATSAKCVPGRPVTIGRPLDHVKCYVLDERLNAVRHGPGELYLGGPAVAAGYIGLENESRDKFVPLIINGRQVDRVYRTGDIVKREKNGDLLFIGRRDNQIKLSGNRIELEEIENALLRIKGIESAAALIRETNGKKNLLAFFVSKEKIEINYIREHLADWLTESMLPHSIIQAKEIPLTSSGKKDRRALLDYLSQPLSRRSDLPPLPRNEIESKIVAIWKDVLDADFDVSVYDDFYSLGGDSLKSLILLEEIDSTFGVTAPPGFFGRFSTVHSLAIQISDLLWEHQSYSHPDPSNFLQSRVYKQLLHLTNGWTGHRVREGGLITSRSNPEAKENFFVCLQSEEELNILSHNLTRKFNVHGMRSGHLVMNYDEESVEKLSSHYVDEIECLEPEGPITIGGICQGGTIAFSVAKKLLAKNYRLRPLILVEQSRLIPYSDKVVFIYPEDSFLNPLKKGDLKFAAFDETYKDNYEFRTIPGGHGTVFEEPNIHFLSSQIEEIIRNAAEFGKKRRGRSENKGPSALAVNYSTTAIDDYSE